MLRSAMLAVSFIGAGSGASHAIEIDIIRFNASVIITVEGEIEAGDSEKFKRFWEENAYDAFRFSIALNSPGGSLSEGIELGKYFRENGVATVVQKYTPRAPMESEWDYSFSAKPMPGSGCYSACALAFMGGVERSVPEGSEIGFHQFYGGTEERSAEDAMVSTQAVSAMISEYLRTMGASPELFEIMSVTPPEGMFIPKKTEMDALGINPVTAFQNFSLAPKEGGIVATAINPSNPGSLERVYEIETFCWKGRPMINLYGLDKSSGLPTYVADPATTHIDGFWIETIAGNKEFTAESIRLYPEQKLLATLVLDIGTARSLGAGSAKISVNSYTASGVFLSGIIHAPDGDKAIAASFMTCTQ